MRENLIFTGIEEKDQENEEDIRQALQDLFRTPLYFGWDHVQLC